MDKTRKKTIVFSILVAVGMLLFVNQSVQAQDRPGGLLGYDGDAENHSFFGKGRSLFSWAIDEEDFGANDGDINVEDFGTPLGSGILVLLTAGAGYATLKSKKQNETNKIKENKQ